MSPRPDLPQAPAGGQLPMPAVPMPAVELPVEDSAYHQFWRTPLWRWWRPLAALLVGAVVFLLLSVLAGLVATSIDLASGRTTLEDLQRMDGDSIKATPMLFLLNNISLALLVPLAILLSRWFFRQHAGWLASVTGRMRWGWLGRCFAVLAPLWLVYLGLETWAQSRTPEGLGLHVNRDTWILLAGILLTTPLQAAGEEYAFRGVITRAMASFLRNRWVGLALGTITSSVLFMLAHGAGDMWLNVFYFCFALIACAMTLRTGGLEAAIAMHVVNNVGSELLLPFTDISGMFDRQAGTADASVLVGVVVPLLGWALVEWQARRTGIVRTAAPGAARQRELEQQLATWQRQVLAWQRSHPA